MLFGMPRALFPQVAQETFGDPPGGGLAIGALYAAVSVGAVLAGLCSGAFTRIRRHGVMVTGSVCAWGLAVAGFAISRRLWIAVACLAVGGAAVGTTLAISGGGLLAVAAMVAASWAFPVLWRYRAPAPGSGVESSTAAAPPRR
jgi:MFS family permease